jgi:hypothetical protein
MTESHDALARRRALATVSAAGVAAVPSPATAALANPLPSRPKYIFGYGSLIQIESRTRTYHRLSPDARRARQAGPR